MKATIKQILGINQEGGMGTYLELRENVHGSKAQVFAFFQDRLNSRINMWSAKFLSWGGKEILIKLVAQAIPTYVMSCFLLPKYICTKLSSAISNFWWSKKQDSKGIHWIAWDKLCEPFSSSGLGFRTFEAFNQALLAKQLWRIVRFPNSLLARVLRGRYFRYSDPLNIKPAYNPSYGWRSILASRPLLESGLKRVIGSGMGTKFWSDPWVPDTPARPPLAISAENNPHLYVSDLIDFTSKSWKVEALKELVARDDIPLILSIRPSASFSDDSFSWIHTKSGAYTVKSGYWTAKARQRGDCDLPFQGPSVTALQAQSWKLPTSRKLKHFVWQIVSGCIPSCQRLTDRHIGVYRRCPRCGADDETINHVFFDCPPAKQVWALSSFSSAPNFFPSQSVFANIDYLLKRARDIGGEGHLNKTFPWILWFIWKARNLKVFEKKDIAPDVTLAIASQEAEAFRVANIRTDAIAIATSHLVPEVPITGNHRFTCQTDGSWAEKDNQSGFGWILLTDGSRSYLGLKSHRRSTTPLHAELDSLLWAMRCLTDLHMFETVFQTDCKDLITLLNEPEEWPTFASELNDFSALKRFFPVFSISFIPRKLNVRADLLSKKA